MVQKKRSTGVEGQRRWLEEKSLYSEAMEHGWQKQSGVVDSGAEEPNLSVAGEKAVHGVYWQKSEPGVCRAAGSMMAREAMAHEDSEAPPVCWPDRRECHEGCCPLRPPLNSRPVPYGRAAAVAAARGERVNQISTGLKRLHRNQWPRTNHQRTRTAAGRLTASD